MDLISNVLNTIINVHPLHPMIVHFPLALTGAALLFFLLALIRKNPYLERAAYYCISLTAVSTVAAGLTGMRDNATRYGGEAPNVQLKIILASLLLVLATVAAVIRWRQKEAHWQPKAVIFYLLAYGVSFLLAGTLGFLGGVIVFGM